MRFGCSSIVLAGLASVACAVPLDLGPNTNTTTISSPLLQLYTTEEPLLNSIQSQLEGLPGCYVSRPHPPSTLTTEYNHDWLTDRQPPPQQAKCFIESNKYFWADMGHFTFDDFCGFYWKAAIMWEWAHVRGCALTACLDPPCTIEVARRKKCDLPGWVNAGE